MTTQDIFVQGDKYFGLMLLVAFLFLNIYRAGLQKHPYYMFLALYTFTLGGYAIGFVKTYLRIIGLE